ncbi:MAG: transketolase [Syntrophobacteraceae bacterium]
MRNILCQTLVDHASGPKLVFLTGDLGFRALEPLRDALGERFINAGIAEQNMVSVAAGLARTGLRPWVYSIAPFVYARPYEQIRNDICMHRLPVILVGNGGGYAYGSMGGTHHALEDYGALLCLQNMRVYVPAFAADVPIIIDQLMRLPGPGYLRLGRCELPRDMELPEYAAWRRLLRGKGPTMVAAGPLAGAILSVTATLPLEQQPDLWVVTELPLSAESIPEGLLSSLRSSQRLIVVEEHVSSGGIGQMLSYCLALMGRMPPVFTHRCALGYVSARYGSQKFHRKECGLDPESILKELCQ